MRSMPLAFRILIACPMLAVSLAATASAKEQWGDLTGQFIYDGNAPNAKIINLPGMVPFPDDSLIVDKQSGAIANVVVHLQTPTGEPVPLIHPDYAKAAHVNPDAILNVLATRVDPHIVLKRTAQSIAVTNKAAFGVDVKIDGIRNQSENHAIAAGKSEFFNASVAEASPLKVGSNIHPWYAGYVVVQDHPYMAKSGIDGSFDIKNLPVGKWTFHFWHEKPGNLQLVKRGGKEEKWIKGKLEVDIKAGKNDLGKILLAEKLFKN